jgi:hypothetical protein
MRMYHKQQESNLGAICLFSPVAEARDSLRKLDASKDKGRVLGGVSHFVLRVRYLSSLISYLGNATLRTLGKGIFIIKVDTSSFPSKLGQRFAL